MAWLFIIAYVLVGWGIFVGLREVDEPLWWCLWIAVVWPVVALFRLGRHIA